MKDCTQLRFGILGTARIAQKNWRALRHSGNSVVTAVASRDIERAREFIAKRQADTAFPDPPRAFSSYGDLLADPAVDAVYLPLPTSLRKEWVIRAADAGKHVLCEKPCAVNATDLREMLAACRGNHVQFMDGVMFMHNQRLDRVRELLIDQERVGSLKRISASFSFRGGRDFRDRNIRAQSALEPLGCLGDLGWYSIRFALWVMDWQLPNRAAGRVISEVSGKGASAAVPAEFSGELFFDGNVSAGFYCSFHADHQQWAMISGTNGFVRIPDFVLPNSDNPVAWEASYASVQKADTGLDLGSRTGPGTQEANMFRNFADQVRSGQLNEEWPDVALRTQQIVDACLTSARADGRPVAVG